MLLFLAVAAVMVNLLIREVIKQKSQAPKGRKRAPTHGQSSKIPSELLMLLHGDRNAAQRLIHSTQQSNPGRSYQWVCDKVLHDIERDRQRG